MCSASVWSCITRIFRKYDIQTKQTILMSPRHLPYTAAPYGNM